MVVSEETLKARALFSQRLSALLADHDMNQNELAKILKVSESTVGKWVLGKSMPRTMGVIQQIADFFGVGKSYFLESHSPTLPELTRKDEREIARDLEDMMHSVASAAYESDDEPEDVEAFKATLKSAMIQAKKIAKKKYTPKKYRKD